MTDGDQLSKKKNNMQIICMSSWKEKNFIFYMPSILTWKSDFVSVRHWGLHSCWLGTDENIIWFCSGQKFSGYFFLLSFFKCLQHNIHFLQEVLQNRRSDLLEWCIIYLLFIQNVISIYEIVTEPIAAVSLWSNDKQICNSNHSFLIQPNKFAASKATNLW